MITWPNHVWASDITYTPMRRGFVYLCASLGCASRWVLAWLLSNTLPTDFCMKAVQEAIKPYDPPEIFNRDQSCQFTSREFTGPTDSQDWDQYGWHWIKRSICMSTRQCAVPAKR